jgi:hypothetical protein
VGVGEPHGEQRLEHARPSNHEAPGLRISRAIVAKPSLDKLPRYGSDRAKIRRAEENVA